MKGKKKMKKKTKEILEILKGFMINSELKNHTAEIVLAPLMGGLLEAPTAQVAFHRRLGHPDHLPAAGQIGRRQN